MTPERVEQLLQAISNTWLGGPREMIRLTMLQVAREVRAGTVPMEQYQRIENENARLALLAGPVHGETLIATVQDHNLREGDTVTVTLAGIDRKFNITSVGPTTFSFVPSD